MKSLSIPERVDVLFVKVSVAAVAPGIVKGKQASYKQDSAQ
jgi:hypothetical protein